MTYLEANATLKGDCSQTLSMKGEVRKRIEKHKTIHGEVAYMHVGWMRRGRGPAAIGVGYNLWGLMKSGDNNCYRNRLGGGCTQGISRDKRKE